MMKPSLIISTIEDLGKMPRYMHRSCVQTLLTSILLAASMYAMQISKIEYDGSNMGSTATGQNLLFTEQYESNIQTTGAETNLGFLCRIDPNDLLLEIGDTFNAAPDAELITQTGIFAYSTPHPKSKRFCMRNIVLSRIIGTETQRFRIYRRIPILTLGCWESLRLQYPQTFNYQSQTDWVLVSTHDESPNPFETPTSTGDDSLLLDRRRSR